MNIQNEHGYSLVESLIAMAILLAVLVPAAMALIYVGSNTIAKDKIESFNYAKNQIEYVIAYQDSRSGLIEIDEKWLVKTKVDSSSNLYTIKVEVFKSDTLSLPLISLQTARIWYRD
ncbi:hypothetical protein A8B79_04295 [Balneola sp. EhC07]|uniref:type IV pilus modification PilV family protein n=1 Tax=Balneola sp. EhC07 TaxID=1849360 RepID=UPI0007F4DBA6|nr:type II secretion system protein [Balneola sp. EhC07]OAN61653.1 hypothetical protein A8B79_04295 [Balneola sp. EhC07]